MPAAILGFLFEHAVQGWCPPIPVLRQLGVRTRGEIDREKFALKAVRGDFQTVRPEGREHADEHSAEEAIRAVGLVYPAATENSVGQLE